MPENSKDEMILITVSWQALQRLLWIDKHEYFATDSIVVKFFAATYIEASLNFLIDAFCRKEKIVNKLKADNSGLGAKLAYFYYKYGLPRKTNTGYEKNKEEIDNAFTGFSTIKDYRDNIAHGNVNGIEKTKEDVLVFRNQAKAIVQKLIEIADENGLDKTDKIAFEEAIKYKEGY